ncbi:MAG: DNA polymerase III subunit beta [Candidatus Taylorbacteria bacterium]|nr:DNA polymerase III subunit beta [Candidatus Taylorbacteria bacterium]
MKIECIKEKLHMAVSKAEKVVSKNLNLPVLSCLLFETKGNNLIIRSTNLDLGLEISIPVKVEQEGKVAIPAQVLSSFLNNLSDDKNIVLETVENTLKIYSSSSEANIKTLSTDDFPTVPMIDEGKTCKISSRDLISGIKSVIYSSSTSSVKPELSSVYIYSHGDEGLVFVATDSFRLAEKTIKTRKVIDLPGVLIPFKNASDILKIFDDVDEEIEINSTKNQISFNFNGLYLVSRVIDGNFPDYKQILPKERKTKVTVLKQDLINSLKISNIFSDNFNQINIVVKNGKNIQIKTKNLNIGENTNKIEADIEGEEIEANFNYRYIVDCLGSIASDSIILSLNGINKPLVIQGSSDKTFTYLVMPMNR